MSQEYRITVTEKGSQEIIDDFCESRPDIIRRRLKSILRKIS